MKNIYYTFLFIIFLAVLCLNSTLQAQTFINPYIGYGVTKLNHPKRDLEFFGDTISRIDRLYSPRVYLGLSITKQINEYWNINIQSDISVQKFEQQDNSFFGRRRIYFWHIRNSVIPTWNIDEKWRAGIGFNFDYLSDSDKFIIQVKSRAEFGGILQVGYQMSKYFNLHLNYRHGLKTIDFASPTSFDPLQSLNLGLGYRFRIKKEK